MTLLGLDLNATRVRAVSGPAGDFPLPVPLDPPGLELPMALSLERPRAEVGRAALRLCRISPHLVCRAFLPHLSESSPRRWTVGRRSLDGRQALEVVWQRLQPVCRSAKGVALILPAYLADDQLQAALKPARQARLSLVGSISSPLALALAAYAEQPWFGYALAADLDDHALTLSTIRTDKGHAQLVETRVYPHLGWQAWQERLLNALADCCVLQSRRDPRDAPSAEQALFEQLDGLLEAAQSGRIIQLGFQGMNWYQNLIIQPEQPAGFCAPLLNRLVAEIENVWTSSWPEGPPGALLLSAAAGRLPGLPSVLRRRMDEWTPVSAGLFAAPEEEDFGDDLLDDHLQAGPNVLVLPEEAPARAAHVLAGAFQRGELPGVHCERAPLPLPQPPEVGPARLHFQGRDYLLNDVSFTLGSQPGCNLVFPADDYLAVSPRHCEIRFEHRAFLLFDRSRAGTLVNDRAVSNAAALQPGDWIRLGPDGPLLRFLGSNVKRAPLTA